MEWRTVASQDQSSYPEAFAIFSPVRAAHMRLVHFLSLFVFVRNHLFIFCMLLNHIFLVKNNWTFTFVHHKKSKKSLTFSKGKLQLNATNKHLKYVNATLFRMSNFNKLHYVWFRRKGWRIAFLVRHHFACWPYFFTLSGPFSLSHVE